MSRTGSNIGKSVTHRNSQRVSSISPRRRPISRRVAPSSASASARVPAAKKAQSPTSAPTASRNPSRSDSDRFLPTGPPREPSSRKVT